MKEDFLAFVWRRRLYDNLCLSGKKTPIHVVSPGILNEDGGPDFKEARIRIGQTEWAGHVEIHVRSSDWYRHGHESDPAYNNVILHVVHENDLEVQTSSGHVIPAVELKDHFDPILLDNWCTIQRSLHWLPCHAHIREVQTMVICNAIERSAIERLSQRSLSWFRRLGQLKGDWTQLAFEKLSYAFGLKINGESFEQLARQTPFAQVIRESYDLTRIEALLFGQAGMLVNPVDNQAKKLRKEYDFLKSKYSLTGIGPGLIQFLRTRPPNFPTVKLAQFAAILHRNPNILTSVLFVSSFSELKKLFKGDVSDYWQTHYAFGKRRKQSTKGLSTVFLQRLTLNAIVPLQYMYFTQIGKDEGIGRIVDLLQSIPAEDHKLIRRWKDEGVHPANALHTQGLLHLERMYCSQKQCLKCQIGSSIIGH